jgi:hypothetical protein
MFVQSTVGGVVQEARRRSLASTDRETHRAGLKVKGPLYELRLR